MEYEDFKKYNFQNLKADILKSYTIEEQEKFTEQQLNEMIIDHLIKKLYELTFNLEKILNRKVL